MKQAYLLVFLIAFAATTFSQQPQQLEENRFLKRLNGKFGVTDSSHKIVVPFLYDLIEYKNKRLIVSRQNLQGLLNVDNELIVSIRYLFVLPRRNDRFILWAPNAFFGLCDVDGKIIIPVNYQGVSSTRLDDFYITRNEKGLNGVYDFNGKNILPEIYKFYTIDGYKIFAVVNNNPEILDLKNPAEVIHLSQDLSFVETAIHHVRGERFFQIVKKQNKYGLINGNNEIVIPIIYDEVKSSQHWRYFIIRTANKVGIINVDGHIVKEPIYDRIELRKEFVILKSKNKKDELYSYK